MGNPDRGADSNANANSNSNTDGNSNADAYCHTDTKACSNAEATPDSAPAALALAQFGNVKAGPHRRTSRVFGVT